jgi:hypothetical protein
MDTVFIPAVTGTGVIALVSLLFSLGLQFIPGLNTWFAPKSEEFKKGFFLLLGLALGFIWFLLGAVALPPAWDIVVAPMSVGTLLLALVEVVLGAGAVQGFYKVLPTPKAVAELKASRAEG